MPVSRSFRPLLLLVAALPVLLYAGARLLAGPGQRANAVIGKQPNGTFLVPTGQIIEPAGSNL